MVAKKTEKANLENKKPFFILMGLVLVLSLLFITLEWSQIVKLYPGIDYDRAFVEDYEIPNTVVNDPPPPLPPPVSRVFETIKLVPDHVITKTIKFSSEDTDEPIPFIGKPVKIIESEPDVPYPWAEEMPLFPGNVFKFLSENVRYPEIAIESNIQGKVLCQFTVNKDGSIVDVAVIRSVHPSLDKEAVRVIESMPKWSPGKQAGKAVRVRFTLPVSFKIIM